MVSEVLPRAWKLAEQFAQRPPVTLAYRRVVFTLQLKRVIQDMLGYGLALEGLGLLDVSRRNGQPILYLLMNNTSVAGVQAIKCTRAEPRRRYSLGGAGLGGCSFGLGT